MRRLLASLALLLSTPIQAQAWDRAMVVFVPTTNPGRGVCEETSGGQDVCATFSNQFSTTQNSVEHGWDGTNADGSHFDELAERRYLSTDNVVVNDGTKVDFKITLDATGEYEIWAGFGSNDETRDIYFEILDNATSVTDCNAGATAIGEYVDVGCNKITDTNFPQNQASITHNFASTNFILRMGADSNLGTETGVNFIRIQKVDHQTTWSQGWSFRSGAGYVTDGAGDYYQSHNSDRVNWYSTGTGNTADAVNAITSGTGPTSDSRDRNNSQDVRLAGMVFFNNNVVNTFQTFEVPRPGTYLLNIAAGDPSFAVSNFHMVAYDGGDVIFTCDNGAVAANEFVDANCDELTAAAWPGSNFTREITLNGFDLFLDMGHPTTSGGYTPLTYVKLEYIPPATERLRYVTCSSVCANDGDGTTASCAASPGGVGSHNSILNVDPRDLGANQEYLKIVTWGNCTDSVVNGWAPTDANFNTGPYHYIEVTCDPGVTDSCRDPDTEGFDATYIIEGRSAFDLNNIEYFRATGLQMRNDGTFQRGTVHMQANHSGEFRIENNHIECVGAVTSGDDGIFLDTQGGTAPKHIVTNNVVNGCHDNIKLRTPAGGHVIAYHNTSVNAVDDGFHVRGANSTDRWDIQNNLVKGSGGSDFEYFSVPATRNEDYNVCEDATCTGVNSVNSYAAVFFDETDDDYRIADTELNLDNNLTSDATYAVPADINGNLRPTSGHVSAGAHEDDYVRYARAGCTFNGTGSGNVCAVADGRSGAYNSLIDWEDEMDDGNYDVGDILPVYIDAESGADFLGFIIDGLTVKVHLQIFPAPGSAHAGVFDNSLGIIEADTSVGIYLQDDVSLTVRGVQFEHVQAGAGWQYLFRTNTDLTTGSVITFDDNIFKSTSVSVDPSQALYFSDGDAKHVVRNNLFFGFSNDIESAGVYTWNQSIEAYIYQNTFHGNSAGVYCDHSDCSEIVIANNLFQNEGDVACRRDSGSWGGGDYNISEDNEGTAARQCPGANTAQSTAVTFTNEGGGDFTIDDTDACVDNNLYSDPDAPVVDDFEGDPRPSSGEIYIGWDEDTVNACGSGGGGFVFPNPIDKITAPLGGLAR